MYFCKCLFSEVNMNNDINNVVNTKILQNVFSVIGNFSEVHICILREKRDCHEYIRLQYSNSTQQVKPAEKCKN